MFILNINKVLEINGLLWMTSLIFVNWEINATVSIIGNEISSCLKINFAPFNSKNLLE